MDYTQNETLRQIFDEHWEEFCDYWAARTRDASQVETVRYDSERHTGVLMRLEWQGLKKIVAVTPQDLLESLSQLNEELRQRCINGAEAAEEAAGYATSQGDYAKREGDRVDALIQEISLLKQRVKEQGDTAEAQGNAAQAMKEEVEEWYSPFRSAAEQWYSGITSEWRSWYAETKNDWYTWFAARKEEWTEWFGDVTSGWRSWYAATKDDWNTWLAARKLQWNEWFSGTTADWELWFAGVKSEWNLIINKISEWASKEQERQSAEEIRLEMMAHPPIPSERGYWMFWDMTVTPHAYKESGYSSRGTMDWPEFFWDYDTMGVGVVTFRDYSRFFIDEEGRFGMDM